MADQTPDDAPGPGSIAIPIGSHKKLAKIAAVTLLLGVVSLLGSDAASKKVSKASEDKRKYDRRLEAVEAWATQYRLQGLVATQASSPPVKKATTDAIEAEITRALDQLHVVAPPDATIARVAPVLDVVFGVSAKVGAAFIVFGMLAFVAAILAALIPWVRKQTDKLFERAVEPPETHKQEGSSAAGAVSSAAMVVTSRGAAMAPIAIVGTAAAGLTAAIVIGAMTITVTPPKTLDAKVSTPTPEAVYDIKPLKINVESGPVNVRREDITPPHVNTDIPPLAFNFPEIPVDQTALTQFTTAMTNYAHALDNQSAHDERLDKLLGEVVRLQRQNAQLETSLELRPTAEKVEALEKEFGELKVASSKVGDAVGSLADGTQTEVDVDSLQYLRKLNAQNDHLVNQLFRPGLVRQNCKTYREILDATGVAAAPCTEKGWRDFWRFVTRRADVEPSNQKTPAP